MTPTLVKKRTASSRPAADADAHESASDPHVTPYQRAQWCASLLDHNIEALRTDRQLARWFDSDATGSGTFLHCARVCGYAPDALRESLRQRGLLTQEQA